MATLAVVMVPLAIFGTQMALGYWDNAKSYRDFTVFRRADSTRSPFSRAGRGTS